ncbi:hypothetical protein HCN44_010321 [Aphidius gifuensis]|uniref:DDE Tnp4 domain-containing protein n=1 Tax=Aphidius gifuensis TaxID=684658 RepID=A0A834XX48_APHGI|nr:hypothetical protein HCN44_010321 [Aphidius gifuensis]
MYIQYYENQVGGGALIHQVHLNQRGQGIGGFLGGLCRGIILLIGSALKPVGKELLSVGMNVLGDVITRQSNLRDSIDNHLTQSGNKLKRKAMDKLDTFLSEGGVGYKIIQALNEIAPRFIRWPNQERCQIMRQRFKEAGGLPNVVGAIDGTFIKIKAPHEDKKVYVTRKCCYAQGICDLDLKFIDVFTGYPGSVSDRKIFKN